MTSKKNHQGGNPTKYNPERSAKVIEYIRRGLPKEQSAYLAGIVPSTLFLWAKVHSEFSDAIKKAESEFEHAQLAVIQEAALNRYNREGNLTRRGSWVAAAWLLERKFGDRYAQRFKGELSGDGGGPITVKVVNYGNLKTLPMPVKAPVETNGKNGSNGSNGHNGNNGPA